MHTAATLYKMNRHLSASLNHPYLLAIACLLLFFGIRLNLIMAYGSQTPYWDDWVMGTRMAMYIESGFDFSWLYGVANDHRSTFSKLTNFIFFKLNDQQWDPYLTMVYDAFLWAIVGTLLLSFGYRERSQINFWLFAFIVAILWTFPLSLFNTLSTVQTYIYYKILFVVCGFWLITCKAFSFKWALGILLVAAACMTTAGGSMAPAAATAVFCFLVIFTKQNRSANMITAGFAIILALFGMYLIFSQGAPNAASSRSVSAFLSSFFKMLSWPNSVKKWPSVIFLMPMLLLAIGVARGKIQSSRIVVFTLLLSAFSVMLAFALAYARGYSGAAPAERYFDFLSLYLVASALALMIVCNNATKPNNLFNRSLTILWILMCVLAVPYHIKVSQFQLGDRAKLVPIQEDIMARYSVTQNPELFKGRQSREVPFPIHSVLEDMFEKLKKTDAIPYNLQSSHMNLDTGENTFTQNGVLNSNIGLYRGLENVLGSFNLKKGAQNAKGEYTSEIFIARRPYAMVPVSGYLGFKETSLFLVGEDNGKVVKIKPPKLSPAYANKWQEVIVKAPDQRYRIVAKDGSDLVWFAFAAPRSVGLLSYWVDKLINIGNKVWLWGLFLMVIGFRKELTRFFETKTV